MCGRFPLISLMIYVPVKDFGGSSNVVEIFFLRHIMQRSEFDIKDSEFIIWLDDLLQG